MIAIICPSRGLIFTETDILIDEVVENFDCKVFRTHNKKIPESFNILTEKALLNKNVDVILYIEEDNVPTFQQVKEMIDRDVDISFVDYGVGGSSCSAKDEKGEILWCGLGVTLIKRRVFEALDRPYFRTDISYRLNDKKWIDVPMKYGGHDIYFFVKARGKGFKITQIEGEARHLKLDGLGKPEINHGLHKISEKPKIIKTQIIS